MKLHYLQSKKHQFQIVLVRKNSQKNWSRWNQLKTVKFIKFNYELIVLSKHFYSFLFHTTRGENAVKIVNKHQKSLSLVTFDSKKVRKICHTSNISQQINCINQFYIKLIYSLRYSENIKFSKFFSTFVNQSHRIRSAYEI